MSVKLNTDWEVLTPEGYKEFVGVQRLPKKQKLLTFFLDDNTQIRITKNHKFIVDNKKEVLAKDLVVGDILSTYSGSYKVIERIEKIKTKEWVYDLVEVRSSNNSYITNDVVSHNCAFIGSSSTLIDPDVLERLSFVEPIDYRFGYNLSIYEYPIENQKYIMSVDTGKGTNRDSSVIQVLKILSKRNVKQVAVYRSNTISTANFSELCISVSQMYNECEIMLENNDLGSSVADMIWHHHEYDKIINLDPKALGIRSTKTTKLKGNLLLKRYVEKRWIEIVDKVTIEELSRYVEEDGKQNIFSAEGNFHDDAVTSLIWGIYYLECPYFDGIDDSGGPTIQLENQIEPPICIISTSTMGDLDEENIKFLEEGGSFGNNKGFYG